MASDDRSENWGLRDVIKDYLPQNSDNTNTNSNSDVPDNNYYSSESTLSILSTIQFEPEEESFLLKTPEEEFYARNGSLSDCVKQFYPNSNKTDTTVAQQKPVAPVSVPISSPVSVSCPVSVSFPTVTVTPPVSVPISCPIQVSCPVSISCPTVAVTSPVSVPVSYPILVSCPVSISFPTVTETPPVSCPIPVSYPVPVSFPTVMETPQVSVPCPIPDSRPVSVSFPTVTVTPPISVTVPCSVPISCPIPDSYPVSSPTITISPPVSVPVPCPISVSYPIPVPVSCPDPVPTRYSVPVQVPNRNITPPLISPIPVTYPASGSRLPKVVRRRRRDPAQGQSQLTRRGRKRKNMEPTMICHVKEEDLKSDGWTWRKYGQKPIKGALYPRNYYRCSGVKGCTARKLVDRTNEDRRMFVVTYIGQHSHSEHTRVRNTRSKKPVVSEVQPEPIIQEKTNIEGRDNLIIHLAGVLEEDVLAKLVAGLDDIASSSSSS